MVGTLYRLLDVGWFIFPLAAIESKEDVSPLSIVPFFSMLHTVTLRMILCKLCQWPIEVPLRYVASISHHHCFEF